jgi:hypothetical protein
VAYEENNGESEQYQLKNRSMAITASGEMAIGRRKWHEMKIIEIGMAKWRNKIMIINSEERRQRSVKKIEIC